MRLICSSIESVGSPQYTRRMCSLCKRDSIVSCRSNLTLSRVVGGEGGGLRTGRGVAAVFLSETILIEPSAFLIVIGIFLTAGLGAAARVNFYPGQIERPGKN